MSYVHYTRAGSGDILAINAPQAQFAAVTQPNPNTTPHCASPLPGTDRRRRGHHPKLFCDHRPGLSLRTRDHLQPRHRQHHLRPQRYEGQLRRKLLSQRSAPACQEHPARHRLRRQPWCQAPGLPQREPEEPCRSQPDRRLHPALRQLALRHHRRRQRVLLPLRQPAGPLRTALHRRPHALELLHLGALARQRQRLARSQHGPRRRMPTTSAPTTVSPTTTFRSST